MSIKDNLLKIKDSIPSGVTLVAVSKFHSSEEVIQAIEAGQRVFGENRVQEAYSKWPEIKKLYPDIKLHLIGALQTNKVAEAVSLFDVIESVDRPKLVNCLIKEMHKQNRPLPCLIQVNIGREPQKSGVLPEEVDDFIKYCRDKKLIIKGLMCIPPSLDSPEPYFAEMQKITQKYNFSVLSMGMSGDFKTATNYGATHVRVGTAIFGKRQ